MGKFIGQLIFSLILVSLLLIVVKSLPDVARYIKLSEM